MNILVITGDNAFGSGHPRFELQKSAVDGLEVVYWGRGSVWPKIPAGHFDVVTAQDPFWRGLFAWIAARRLGARLNVQVHTDLAVQSYVRRALAQMMLRRADSVRVVTEKLKQQVARMGVRGKITVLPIFVDVSKFSSVQRREHASKNILWIGRFEEEKDPLEAIEVFKRVLQVVPDARLTMLGEGSLLPHARQQAADIPGIEIAGKQDPLVFLETADVVLSTSKHESWGAVFIEALAAGVPVVAPDVGIAGIAGNVKIAPREKLAEAVVEGLQNPVRGELTIELPNAEEWARQWRASL